MKEIAAFFAKGGVEGAVLALITVCLTALVKKPVKRYAEKRALPAKVTRFIPLIPFVLGGILSALAVWCKRGTFSFGDEFFELWLCASGASVALYSCYENFRDSGKVSFKDELKGAVFALLEEKLSGSDKAVLKELTQNITERCRRFFAEEKDFCAELRDLLCGYLKDEEADEIAEKVSQIRTELYGVCYSGEVEKVACTATETYEYEVHKTRSAVAGNVHEDERKEKKD